MNAGQYIDLALDDDYVRTQMREAAVHARKAFVRGRNQPTKRAVQDQKLLDHIAAAAYADRRMAHVSRAVAAEPPH